MVDLKKARVLLGKTGGSMTDEEVVKLRNNLYTLISKMIDINVSILKLCKKQ